MDYLTQGFRLGRWFRIGVIVSWTFFLGALYFISQGGDLVWSTYFFLLLFATVLVHEFGHALSCRAVGGEAVVIILGPLGGGAFVSPPMNPTAWLITTVCGPLVNAILWPVFWGLFRFGIPTLATHMDVTG